MISPINHQSLAEPFSRRSEKLRSFVSPLVGIVHSVQQVMAWPGEPRLFNCACRLADSRDFGLKVFGIDACGISTDVESAVTSAIGEAVERYSARQFDKDSFPLCRASEFPLPVPPPESFALFATEQHQDPTFRFRPFTDQSAVRWVRARQLSDGVEYGLPAQLVYLAYPFSADEDAIGYSTSNGTALGATEPDAILHALLEAIERDAFFSTWYNYLSLPEIDFRASARLRSLSRRYFDRTGSSFKLIDLSALVSIPTAMCVVRSLRGDRPAVAVGAAAALTFEHAATKAMLEAFHTQDWARSLLAVRSDREFGGNFEQVQTFEDHVYMFSLPEFAEQTTFLDIRRDQLPLPTEWDIQMEPPAALVEIARRLRDQEVEAYHVDVTSPDVRLAGLSAAHVCVPKFTKINATHKWRFLGGERLGQRPFSLGLKPLPSSFPDVNHLPHPFP